VFELVVIVGIVVGGYVLSLKLNPYVKCRRCKNLLPPHLSKVQGDGTNASLRPPTDLWATCQGGRSVTRHG